VNNTALALFQAVSGAEYLSANGVVSTGGCIVTQTSGAVLGGATLGGLDAGTLTVTGQSGSVTLSPMPETSGYYLASLAIGFIPMSGGVFMFHATGGTTVGGFDTSVSLPEPLLTWTNQGAAATVARSAGLPVSWSSGAPSTAVFITGSSSATVGGQSISGAFSCVAPVSAGQFTIPGYVLQALPEGAGDITVANYAKYQSFTAQGIDVGTAISYVSYQVNTIYN
jgi:hypothetical protein